MPRGVKGFEKGKSGNPGGRPKSAKELAQLIQDHKDYPSLVTKLFKLTNSYDEATQIKAIKELFERSCGKAPQELKLDAASDKDTKITVEIVESGK